jgi:hypothetical protein
MTVKTSNYSKKVTAHSIAVSRLTDVSRIDNLPTELKMEVDVLISFFKAYDMGQHKDKGIKLEGDTLTKEQVLELVINATGYKKWSFFVDEEYDFNPDWVREQFNLDVKDEDIVEYKLERSAKSRNDVWLITVVCLPGCVHLGFDTDRADHYIDHLVPNTNAEKEIEKNFE